MDVKQFASLGLSAWFLAAGVALAQPQQALKPDLRDEVRRLVQQLDARQLDQRQAAQQQLIEMGPDILPHLPEPRPRMSAEMREGILSVRSVLEVQAAHSAVNASRVTLEVRDKPVLDVLQELARQTGNRIVDFRDFRGQPKRNPPVTVSFAKVTFWEVLDEVLGQAGLAVYSYAIDDEGEPLRGVAIVNRATPPAGEDKRTDYQGAFRFEPLHVITRRGLRDPAQNGLELEIEVAWEPRLTPVSLKVLYDSFACLDDRGQPLALEVAGEREIEMHSGTVGSFPVRYGLPDPQARQLQTLQGKIEGLIPGGRETFRFDKLAAAKNQRQKKAGATVILERVRKINPRQQDQDLIDEQPAGNIWEVRIRVQFETSGVALESHLMDWVTENEARLVDPQGKTIEWATMEKTREVGDEFGVAYLFGLDDDIAGYTFQYKTPVALLKKQIPFQFKEIPLP
jgi:hypothetical protein